MERNLILDMLEDSRLQIMRLGESNIRHVDDSDLQILAFRCFKMDMSRDSRSNNMLKNAVFCRNCSGCVPLDRRLFFPKQHFFPISVHKVCKLAGQFINLLECLAFSCNKAAPGKFAFGAGRDPPVPDFLTSPQVPRCCLVAGKPSNP